MKNKRVVVTGMGVVAPNGIGLEAFSNALSAGVSGIRYLPELAELKFGCQIGGVPPLTEAQKEAFFTPLELKSLKASGIIYGLMAGVEAWQQAGLPIQEDPEAPPDWDSGCIFGSGIAGAEVMRDATYLIDDQKVKRLGSTSVPQVMASGISAHLGGRLGLGNQVTSNASACSTGSESILMAYDRIRSGAALRMLCGACDSSGPYVWGGFDAMRVTTRKANEHPEQGSRPLSATAAGFVPGSGAGALILEELETALDRGAPILAEVLGGAINSGGQRSGGTMTAPNRHAIVRCMQDALHRTGVRPEEIDLISGHLTATLFDPIEVEQWTLALNLSGKDFPFINSLKSMIGHCLSAAGAIESVAAVIQLQQNLVHASLNSEDLHPDIALLIDPECVPQSSLNVPVKTVVKSSFGFGDVNSCVIFKAYSE